MRASAAGGGGPYLPEEEPAIPRASKPEADEQEHAPPPPTRRRGEEEEEEEGDEEPPPAEFQFVLGPAMPNCWEPAVVPLSSSSSSSLILHTAKTEVPPPPGESKAAEAKSWGGGGQQLPKQASCYQCKLSKVRCNREVPCERCVRLDLACLPLKRSRGASLKLHKTKKQLAAELAAAAASSSSSTTSTKSQPVGVDLLTDAGHHTALRIRHRRIGQGSGHPAGKGVGGGGGGGGGDGDPNQHVWVHVVAATPTTPASEDEILRRCAEVMSSTFSQMKAEGRVNDQRTALLLKSWSLSNQGHKVDISKGVCGMMLKQLGSSMHTSGPAPDPNVPSDHSLCDGQGNFFNVQCLPLYLKQLMDPVSAVAGYISYLGEYQLISNACFSDRFMTVEDMEFKYRRAQILPDFLWSSLLDPEELEEFYTRYMEFLCSEPRPNKQMSCVCKCVDRLGNVFIGFIRLRSVFAEGGNYVSEVLSIVPLPGSRHVTYLGEYEWGMDAGVMPGASASSISESSAGGGRITPPQPPQPPPASSVMPTGVNFWSPQRPQGSDGEGGVNPLPQQHGGLPLGGGGGGGGGEVLRQSPRSAPQEYRPPLPGHVATGRAPPSRSSPHPSAFVSSYSAASLYPDGMSTNPTSSMTSNAMPLQIEHVPSPAFKYPPPYPPERHETNHPNPIMGPSYQPMTAGMPSPYPVPITHQQPVFSDKRGHGDQQQQGILNVPMPMQFPHTGASSPKRPRHETTPSYYYPSLPSQSPPNPLSFMPRHLEPPFVGVGGGDSSGSSGRHNNSNNNISKGPMASSDGSGNRNDSTQVSTAYEELQSSLDTWWANG